VLLAGHALAPSGPGLVLSAPGVTPLVAAAALSVLNWLFIEPYVTGQMFERYELEVGAAGSRGAHRCRPGAGRGGQRQSRGRGGRRPAMQACGSTAPSCMGLPRSKLRGCARRPRSNQPAACPAPPRQNKASKTAEDEAKIKDMVKKFGA
jgi:hypothetical protein